MKKIIFVITALVIVIAGWLFLRRTPESILQKVVKSNFGVNMKEINPTVTHFDELWYPIQDGYCYIEFKYEGDHPAFFEQFERLSPDKTMSYGPINSHFRNLQEGYYMFMQEVRTPDNIKVLVIDPKERTGVLYYIYI